MSEPTTLASWAAAIAGALRARGCDPAPLFAQAGLDYAATAMAGMRFPVRGMTRLWQLAVATTADPAFALDVPRYVRPATLHALGQSLRASLSLEDALLRMARYSRLVTDGAELALETDGTTIAAVYLPPRHDVPLADAAYEAFMATAVQLGRALAGANDGLLACEFRHAAPADQRPYERFFGCPVRFGERRNRLVFDPAKLQAPLSGGDPQRVRSLDAAAAAYLARFDAAPVSQRVRELVIRRLPAGEPTRADIAAALRLTPRTLLRRLAAEGASYKDLLNDARRELALSYLRQGRSAAEITYLLGFADPSNFTRAFKRWIGAAPTTWRERTLKSSAK